MPYLSELMGLQRFLAIRACASLEAGNHQQARSTLRVMLQLSRASASHPTLIGFLVGLTNMEISLSVIWHGMNSQQWTAEDLHWIQEQLSENVFLQRLERALTTEMVMFQIGASEYLKKVGLRESGNLVKLLAPLNGSPSGESRSSSAGILAVLAPKGIWDHNMANGCRISYTHGIQPVRERRLPAPNALLDNFRTRNHRNFLASLTVPATSKVTERGFHLTVAIDMARMACAAERYQLEHGDYPESMDLLVPEFLAEVPNDILTPHAPLIYGSGLHGDRYRIYSLGRNGIDDGGVVIFHDNAKKRTRRDLAKGDWAWGYSFAMPKSKSD